jgi:dipeptidyl aminopeptidase/acylaminoacyl peptidase
MIGESDMNKKRLPYGSWPSPISAAMVATCGTGSSALPRELQADETGIYWIESRPQEGGRYVVRRLDAMGTITTCTPEGFSARTRVHEYGGGAMLLWHGTLFLSNGNDQRLYRQDPGEMLRPITPEPPPGEQLRYADGCITPDGSSLIYICERHKADGEVDNFLIKLSPDGEHDPLTLHAEHDFYANPRVSPDGEKLLWLTWDHPQMPWDGTDLWVADLQGATINSVKHVAGGDSEAIFQPEWDLEGAVLFVSDRTGWWNLYRSKNEEIVAITSEEIEFGVPLWNLGVKTYIQLDDTTILGCYKQQGMQGMGIINTRSGEIEHLDIPYTYLVPSMAIGLGQRIWFFAGSPFDFPSLTCLKLETREFEQIVEIQPTQIDRGFISQPEQIAFKSPLGASSYAYYYPATHPGFEGMQAERPPLIVLGHGGPTSAARLYFNPEIQFWTSRGFSVVDVDYSGSTGYGRAYRERLRGNLGVADVADCVEAACYLAENKHVDPERLLITGGSAGGYIVLCALTGYDIFQAGASYYGIADIVSLIKDSHKFEAKYEVSLIGPYPEYAEVYVQRSPINHADKLSCPVILFQGLEDTVVPPSQSETFIKALEENSIYHKYITFEGEGHGFRRSENIKIALEAELDFYREVLKIA